MDREALRWIEMLDNDAVDDDGFPVVSIELRFKMFEKGQDWLIKRQKLRPKDDTEGQGITDMRSWMSDPHVEQWLDQMMFDRGYVKMPEIKPGRPGAAQRPIRERYKQFTDATKAAKGANDSSGWDKMLTGPPPEEEEES